MNEDSQRQIHQLWAIAKMYHELAVSLKSQIEEVQLRLKIGEFAKQCEDPSYLSQNTALLYASAHLASSAIRLYSIDEIWNNKSKRWGEYRRIEKTEERDKEAIEKDLETHLNSVIHFLLRHMVAHSESHWKDLKGSRIAYEAMQAVYCNLDYNTTFAVMSEVVKSVGNDLQYSP